MATTKRDSILNTKGSNVDAHYGPWDSIEEYEEWNKSTGRMNIIDAVTICVRTAYNTLTKYVRENGKWRKEGSVDIPEQGTQSTGDVERRVNGDIVIKNLSVSAEKLSKKIQARVLDRTYNSDTPDGMGYVVLEADMTFDDQITTGHTIYEIRYNYDLEGRTVAIPSGCILKFNGGSLYNGAISGGDIRISGNYEDGINVSVLGVNDTKDFVVRHCKYGNEAYKSLVDTSKFASARNGIVVDDNVEVTANVDLYTNICGSSKDKQINVASDCNYGFRVMKEGVSITNVTIRKNLPALVVGARTSDKREAIRGAESNLTVRDCVIYGGVSVYNVTEDESMYSKFVNNIHIENNQIIADFTQIYDDWNINIKDVLFFYGCSDVYVRNNYIKATNVLRVFKSSALTTDNVQPYFINQFQNPTNIHIENNTIEAEGHMMYNSDTNEYSPSGKQVYDMYCGTKNVFIKGNTFKVKDFSVLFENKSIQYNGVPANIEIEGNIIDCNCNVMFMKLTNNEYVRFNNNIVRTTPYKYSSAPFGIFGVNLIAKNNVMSYDYVTSDEFKTHDCFITLNESEAFPELGLESKPIKTVEFSGNKVSKMWRIRPTSVEYFKYYDNDIDCIEHELDITTRNPLATIDIRKSICNNLKNPIIIVQSIASISNVYVKATVLNRDQYFSRVIDTSASKLEKRQDWLNRIESNYPVVAQSDDGNLQFFIPNKVSLSKLKYYLTKKDDSFSVYLEDDGYNYMIIHDVDGWKAYDSKAICKRKLTTAERNALNLTDSAKDIGTMVIDSTSNKPYWWTGTKWADSTGA